MKHKQTFVGMAIGAVVVLGLGSLVCNYWLQNPADILSRHCIANGGTPQFNINFPLKKITSVYGELECQFDY